MNKNNPEKSGHWSEISRVWEQVGSPLRPVKQDIGFVTAGINNWTKQNGAPHALILGVTPELYNLAWPDGTELIAIDHTKNMIDAIWPGSRSQVICADWPSLPLREKSLDIILCDGGIHLMNFPDSLEKFVDKLGYVVKSDGLCIFRLFIPPECKEKSGDVLDDLFASRISNLNILKLRLGMSLQESSEKGIELSKIWNTLHQAAPDFNQLAEKIGWPIEHLLAINTYRDSPNRYHFLSVNEVEQTICNTPPGFQLESVHVPDYELGKRCPTVVFRRT